MVLRVFCIVFVLFGTEVYSCSDTKKIKACEAVFSPEAMKKTCCPPMKQFVEANAMCQKKSCSTEFTCSVSKCVSNVYGILTDGKIDECKCRAVLKRLSKENPETKPLNDEVEKNCLNGGYKRFVTSDPNCDTMKYQVCAYVSYLMGCKKFSWWPPSCKKLSKNVAVCKPYLYEYLEKINKKSCYGV